MNIILLISDTFRYDNLFDRAEMPVNTPCLDAFSQRSVSMSNFYTGSFPTIPQRTDLISGRIGWPWYPWQHLDMSTKNALPRLLSDNGYVTQLLCDCPHLFNAGFQNTFHAAHRLRGQEGDLYMLRMNHEIREVMPANKTREGRWFRNSNLVDRHCWVNRNWSREDDRFAPRTANIAIEWLEENYKFHPFFLWVDLFDPHEPWDPPEYLVRKYDPDYTGIPMLHPNYGKASAYTRAELKNLRAHYCAEAELVDRSVGRILQRIDDLGLYRNSIVIFTTDHGMCLGEHNRTGKSNISADDGRYWPIYPEMAHIPFLVAAPGLKAGRTVETIAQPADIMPTLFDLAGLKLKAPEPLHGISFAPHLRGKARADIRDFAVASSCLSRRNGKVPLGVNTPVLYTRDWAYAPIGSRGRKELYDISRDPLATQDVSAKHVRVMQELHGKLLAWLKRIKAPAEAMDTLAR